MSRGATAGGRAQPHVRWPGPAALALCLWLPGLVAAQAIPAAEFATRRRALMDRTRDGITLLHAESVEKPESQPSFMQNSTFYYFTGEGGLPSAVLALDAPRGEARLFVPPAPSAFGFKVEHVVPEPGVASAARLGVTSVQPWDSLAPYLHRRVAQGATTLYVDASRRPEATGVPDGFAAIAGSRGLWAQSLAQAFPTATVTSAALAIRELRFAKSPAEVAVLRDNAQKTVAALRAAIAAIRPGVRQRAIEMTVASACVRAGAVGPSFWPWTMAGPNAHVPALVRSVYSYAQLDRSMKSGEVVRVDIGCTDHNYGADVGRTVPVSGRFTDGQRETWDLLIAAYRTGMNHIHAGVAIADVLATSRAEIARRQPTLKTAQGRRAADVLLGRGGMAQWSLHSVGIDSGETPMPVLVAGAVIAFEPIFSVDDDAFYLEDMILVTEHGHEVLSAGLPYTAREIEAAMGVRR